MKRFYIFHKRYLYVFTLWSLCNLSTHAQRLPGLYRDDPSAIPMSYAYPRTYLIDEISVEGASHLDTDALINLSGLVVGDSITLPSDRTAEVIRRLWKQRILEDISLVGEQVSEGHLRLVLRVRERPRVTRVAYQGVSKTESDDLKGKSRRILGRVLNQTLLQGHKKEIIAYFTDKGYPNASVSFEEVADTIIANGVALSVDIKKRRKVRVRGFVLSTDDALSTAALKRQFKGMRGPLRFRLHHEFVRSAVYAIHHPWRWIKKVCDFQRPARTRVQLANALHAHVFLNFFKSAKWSPDKYGEGKNNILTYAQSKGYRNIQIATDSIRFAPEGVYLYAHYVPGRIHYLRDLQWEGNYLYSDTLLTQVLGIAPGSVYDPSLIEKKLNFNPQGLDVSSLYMDDGYLFFRVTPVEVAVVGDSIDLEMRLYEGKRAHIDQVIITGNEQVHDYVVLRELHTLPGEKFSRSDLIRSQQRLGQLPFIEPSETNPVPLPKESEEEVDIEWRVAEKSGDQIELSAGWGGGIGLVGSLGLVLNNFSLKKLSKMRRWRPLPTGEGQQLALRFRSNGRPFQSYSASFSEPWLGGRKPNYFTVSYSFSRESYLNSFSREITGRFSIHNFLIGLTRRLAWPDDYFRLGQTFSYRGYVLDNVQNRTLGFNNGRSNNLSLTLSLERNSLDEVIFPQSGALLSLSTELTPPHSLWRNIEYATAADADIYRWISYHKWIFDLKYYLSLAKNFVLESRTHMGFIGRYTQRAPQTPFERFSLGGDGITGQNFVLGTDIIGLRGYPNNSLRPSDAVQNIDGGASFVKTTFELRYAIVKSPGTTMFVTTFFESGNSWLSVKDFSPFDVFPSTGIGIRALLPAVGFLGIDWGYRFRTLPGRFDHGSEIHFSIGQTIR